MLRPSKVWPGVAFVAPDTADGFTTGAATPLCFLLFPCFSELLRSAGAASPWRLSGSMMLVSRVAVPAENWSPEAPATLTSIAAAAVTSDRASTAFEKRFKRIPPLRFDPGPDPAEPPLASVRSRYPVLSHVADGGSGQKKGRLVAGPLVCQSFRLTA